MRYCQTHSSTAKPRMLQNRLRLFLPDGLGHHVQVIVHHCSTQLQVVMRFDTLRRGLCNTLAISTFKLTGEKVTESR